MGKFRWHRVRTVALAKNSTIRIKPLKYEQEYTDTPQYPPILDTSYEARKRREKSEWHEQIKSLKTVEEKLMKINMPRYYGWRTTMFEENDIPYNCLPLVQHATRTHLKDFKGLPSYLPKLDEADELMLEIKPQIEEALLFEYNYRSRKHEYVNDGNPVSPSTLDDIIGRSVIQQINRILLGNLSKKLPHLLKCQVETDPRIESFWSVGGMNPPIIVKKIKENISFFKDKANEPVDRWMQYIGSPALHLRHELPLPPVVDMQESESADLDVPFFKYDPKVIGFHVDRRHGTNIPGFWPGDPNEFGLLSYHHRGHILRRWEHYGPDDRAETLHVQAILASYAWLLSQACYQGFSTFNDVTYPFVTQTVITNGKLWSFYLYQLNTTLLHSDQVLNNPRRNLCWGTPEMKLFEAIEDGKVIGFNDEVLRYLLKFYLNTPRAREGVEMKPYLNKEEMHLADIDDEKRRAWLEQEFKHMYANRERHILPYEIYNWEFLYKIRHKTRPIEPRRRPFELQNVNPFRRRYDEHVPKYIPRKFREKGKWRKKFEDMYYP
ncbi:large ribosomal subunit protein mL65 [Periplaneta americana]|uniref:28S ribosomal protein S30, mitochondrial n=1 Tax=Periplaneta americana TaxID=6978 RepID=A0ABQ8SI25_PERAM|nr:hypothetical protein ANN_15367 [Periplaneta americana]